MKSKKMKYCESLVEKYLGDCKVHWSKSMTKTWGTYSKEGGITLSYWIQYTDNNEMVDTVLHEVAHAFKGIKHNIWWKLKFKKLLKAEGIRRKAREYPLKDVEDYLEAAKAIEKYR